MLHRAITLIALLALVGPVGCGGDDNDAQTETRAVTAPVADPERYCALTRALEADGERFFAGLGRDATPAEFKAAERRFVEHLAGKLRELEQVAPTEIKADVPKFLDGMRQRAGLQTASNVSEAEASAAEKRILAYEKRNCR